MKKLISIIIIGIVGIIILVPTVINWPSGDRGGGNGIDEGETTVQIRVYLVSENKVVKMPLEEYLVGVVAAEMPAKFEVEALKAQAIAARTYTAKRMLLFKQEHHPGKKGAEICTDSTHCQAWSTKEELKQRWGLLKYPLYIHKVRNAVEETRGLVMTYNGQLTDPVYHGSCGGEGTADSETVWKFSIPYLRGVNCSWDDMNNPSLTKEFSVDAEDIAVKLGLTKPSTQEIKKMLQDSKFRGKRLTEITTKSGEIISGNIFRTKLGLASAVMSWQVLGDEIKFITKGKGHGVGMCQYGANGMAKKGKNCKEILNYYYKGINITNLNKITSQ